MIEVLCSLELAQQLQFQGFENSNGSAKDIVSHSNSNLMLGLEFFGAGRFLPYTYHLMKCALNLKYSILSKRKTTDIRSLLFAEILTFFLSFLLIAIAPISASIPSYVPTDSISLDCSSSIFPSSVKMSSSPSEFKYDSSVVTRIYNIDSHIFQYQKTLPCIFRKQTTYTFTVSTGPKFIQLHFQPIKHEILDISKALFSVSVAGYTLLGTSKFSKHNLLVDYAIREFCIIIVGQVVNVTFTPSLHISESYAFVNKIEVVSMPSILYIKEDFPLPLVGYPSRGYYIQNSRALEMMHRVNMGGDSISPKEDTGMFRFWIEDAGYLTSDESSTRTIESEVAINFSSLMPAYTAPKKVNASARIVTTEGSFANWSFPVDSRFYYLVRLHFCDISGWTEANEGVFRISINNHAVEDHADVLHWSHGAGIPIYKDYIVNFSRHSEGIKHLSVAIGILNEPDDISGLAILNGLEIFKLSDLSNNLAGPYPFGTNDGHDQKFPRSSEYEDIKLVIALWSFMGFDMVLVLL
ncbi:Malectin/receptor-like protein kinase family protein [Theobroma cacao]|uniref:Malectin/receptor-like protein kinase family protein n=1 Tax=Theobroma cacao TaxID=3641 RepID=A0A061EB39_THECC|nr:Malectin/receptor-like protein kinase family protein [Theobroma cacao]